MFTESYIHRASKLGEMAAVAVMTNEAENNLAERLDEDRFRQNLHITLKSLVARSTTSRSGPFWLNLSYEMCSFKVTHFLNFWFQTTKTF